MGAPGNRGLFRLAVEGPAVDALGLEEDHRILILDGADQQPLRIVGIGRHHHLDAADVGEYAFRTLRMGLAAADAAAAGHAHRHRRVEFTGGPVSQARQLADDLIEGGVGVVGELDLHHRLQPMHAHADGRTDDATLGDRRIQHPLLAVLALQTIGAAEHAAEVAHILAHQDHAGVALQHHIQCGVDRLDHVHLRHDGSPTLSGAARCAAAASS